MVTIQSSTVPIQFCIDSAILYRKRCRNKYRRTMTIRRVGKRAQRSATHHFYATAVHMVGYGALRALTPYVKNPAAAGFAPELEGIYSAFALCLCVRTLLITFSAAFLPARKA